ncbi:MAG: hypothetical protein K1X56_09035 [Flavobacteriales bacterium]|nr:hypothetical protein [Flavobacteriales bacterium]
MIELTEKENNDFISVLKNEKRASLFKLFSRTDKGKGGDRKKLFQFIFDKPYSEKEDFLLRNEFRLLKEKWRDFLAGLFLKRSTEESRHYRDLLLLKELFRRNESEVLEREILRVKKYLRDGEDEEVLKEVLLLEQRYLINQAGISLQNLSQIRSINEELLMIDQRIHRRTRLYAESVKAWNYRMLQIYDPGGAYFYQLPVDLLQSENESDTEARFYLLKIKSLYAPQHERLELLLEMVQLAEKIQRKGFPKGRELAVIYSNLGVEYSFVPDYDQSLEQFRKSVELKNEIQQINFHQILFNYISVCIKSGNTDRAMQLIDKYGTALNNDSFLSPRYRVVHIMALVFTGEIKKAKQIFPEQLKEGNYENYIYHRVVQLILFFEDGKIDLAMNECLNLLQTVKGKSGLDHHLLFLKSFRKIMEQSMQMEDRKKLSNAFIKGMLTETNPDKFLQQNVIPLIWLRKKLLLSQDS